jgi:vancomycin resistance protein YoaR
MDDQITESSADASPVLGESPGALTPSEPVPEAGTSSGEPATGGERPRRRWVRALVLLPVVLLGLVIIAWAVDESSGGVPRNVRLAGVDIGGLSEARLSARVSAIAEEYGATPVELVSGRRTYTTTAAEIGLMVDEDRTADSALDVGQDVFVLLRPLDWVRSFVTEREAPLEFLVSDEQVASTTVELEGDARIPPTEPTVELVDGTFHVVAGVDGTGIDPVQVAAALPRAAAMAEPGETIRIEVPPGPIPPLGSEDEARAAASAAESLVGDPVEISTSAGNRTIEPDELRGWVVLTSLPDGEVQVDLDPAKVATSLRADFADIDGHPVDASFTLEGGVPVIRPDEPGLICCSSDSAARILAALHDGSRAVTLELVEGPATFTTTDAEAWGITQAVGGNNAWRDGAPTTAGAGFTTYHSAGGNRVINIHRMADLVRGAVIPPGGSFSINDHVGKRTTANGFVSAGAIANGQHVDEIGGGVSQFATTTFNAAYFAGLDIDEYQAHSEYFDRYPRGREATMGFPSPDLKFTNNTPYGILIWTSYTDTSLTVTLYSTPYATAEQTGISEATSGRCRVVVTTRTRTFPDGHTEDDTFRARYRPGPGQGC